MIDAAELRFHRELRARLSEMIEAETDQLASGNAPDFATYRNRVGRISALRDALTIAAEIEHKVSGRTTQR